MSYSVEQSSYCDLLKLSLFDSKICSLQTDTSSYSSFRSDADVRRDPARIREALVVLSFTCPPLGGERGSGPYLGGWPPLPPLFFLTL